MRAWFPRLLGRQILARVQNRLAVLKMQGQALDVLSILAIGAVNPISKEGSVRQVRQATLAFLVALLHTWLIRTNQAYWRSVLTVRRNLNFQMQAVMSLVKAETTSMMTDSSRKTIPPDSAVQAFTTAGVLRASTALGRGQERKMIARVCIQAIPVAPVVWTISLPMLTSSKVFPRTLLLRKRRIAIAALAPRWDQFMRDMGPPEPLRSAHPPLARAAPLGTPLAALLGAPRKSTHQPPRENHLEVPLEGLLRHLTPSKKMESRVVDRKHGRFATTSTLRLHDDDEMG
mmetsp:Transcript_144978/g.361643  ORF Transcript_144978/g.361643 Transcript_144978/m.361643 type:complete len:288 (+) Transcript_144978:657-1520(+)